MSRHIDVLLMNLSVIFLSETKITIERAIKDLYYLISILLINMNTTRKRQCLSYFSFIISIPTTPIADLLTVKSISLKRSQLYRRTFCLAVLLGRDEIIKFYALFLNQEITNVK